MDLRGLMFQVGAAAMQVAAAGHTDEARKILGDTRRALYKILAEDDPGDAARRGLARRTPPPAAAPARQAAGALSGVKPVTVRPWLVRV